MQVQDINEQEAQARENPRVKAAAVAPAPVQPQPERLRDGVVQSTDSESESDNLESRVKPEDRKQFKWTQFYEDLLEELLVKHMFDFTAASKEMSKMVNDPCEIDEGRAEFYEITPKVLQMKWTDIEI